MHDVIEPLSDFDAIPSEEQLTIPRILPQMDDRLVTIVTIARLIESLTDEIDADTKVLETKTERLKDLSERQLPDLLQNVGLKELSLVGGRKVSIKTDYFASIPKGSAATYAWLRERNMGGIIKTEIQVDKSHLRQLAAASIPYETNESVHHSTLRAFVKEQFEAGNELPSELFKVHTVERAVIK